MNPLDLQRKWRDVFEAARVPPTVASGQFAGWRIHRQQVPDTATLLRIGWTDMTVLQRVTLERMHLPPLQWEVVMEDSLQELRKHLPIWTVAKGRVLVTGLGLGCVVRGLLLNPAVTAIDVLELDHALLEWVGNTLVREPRVTLHLANALTWEPPAGARWDYAWHDICESPTGDGPNLDVLHCELLSRYRRYVGQQGAWGLKRWVKRLWPAPLLGAAA